MANRPSFVLRIAVLVCLLAVACASESDYEGSPHKVQVMLGMHANFYHSWRGDTNDEAGFGTDIRIVRAILEMLDEANESGLDAKVYWDMDNLFTLETILPEHAPDIIKDIRRRVEQGHDEVLLLSYSNTLLAGATEKEMSAAGNASGGSRSILPSARCRGDGGSVRCALARRHRARDRCSSVGPRAPNHGTATDSPGVPRESDTRSG